MDFAQQQRQPGKHAVGIGIVLAMHVVLGWALVTGLAQRMIEVIKAPIETKIIEEVRAASAAAAREPAAAAEVRAAAPFLRAAARK